MMQCTLAFTFICYYDFVQISLNTDLVYVPAPPVLYAVFKVLLLPYMPKGKAPLPKSFMLLPNVTLVRTLQLAKAANPMLVTLSGMITPVRLVQ